MKRLSLLAYAILMSFVALPATAQRDERPYYGDEASRYERDRYATQRTDDRVLHDEVHHAIEDALGAEADGIEVTVRRGRVVLSGTVGDREARQIAHDVAHDVPGVRSVSLARLHTARWR